MNSQMNVRLFIQSQNADKSRILYYYLPNTSTLRSLSHQTLTCLPITQIHTHTEMKKKVEEITETIQCICFCNEGIVNFYSKSF